MSSYSRPTGLPSGVTDNVHSFEDTTVFSFSLNNITLIAEIQIKTTIDNSTLFHIPDLSSVTIYKLFNVYINNPYLDMI